TIGGTAGNDITVDGAFGTGVSVVAMTHGTVKFFNNRISSDFDGISLEEVDGDVEVSGNTFVCASTGLNLQHLGGDILIHGNDFAGRRPTPADPGNGFGIQAAVINGNVVIGTLADGNTFHDLT